MLSGETSPDRLAVQSLSLGAKLVRRALVSSLSPDGLPLVALTQTHCCGVYLLAGHTSSAPCTRDNVSPLVRLSPNAPTRAAKRHISSTQLLFWPSNGLTYGRYTTLPKDSNRTFSITVTLWVICNSHMFMHLPLTIVNPFPSRFLSCQGFNIV